MSLVKIPIVVIFMIGLKKQQNHVFVPVMSVSTPCRPPIPRQPGRKSTWQPNRAFWLVGRNDPCCGRFTLHCSICRVSDISCGHPVHDPNEPIKPTSDFRQAKPECRSGESLCGRRSGCSRSAGRDRTSEPSSCENSRTRQSADRPVP